MDKEEKNLSLGEEKPEMLLEEPSKVDQIQIEVNEGKKELEKSVAHSKISKEAF